jgi:SHS2 domain-containing protein
VSIRGWGPTRAEAFAQATLGVFALLVAPDEVHAREQREVRAQAGSPEALLASWIDECLYVHEIEGFVARWVSLTVCTETLAHGVLHGEPIEAGRHRMGPGIRTTTSHRLEVAPGQEGYEARLVVAIAPGPGAQASPK